MKKSLSLDTVFADRPFHERFDLARNAGFDQVEFGAWTDLDISLIAEKLRANRLRLAAMAGAHGHSFAEPARREDFLEYLSQSIAVAKCFGCRNLLIPSLGDSALPGCRVGDYTCIAAATRTLFEGAAKADRAGMTLHLQPIGNGTAKSLIRSAQSAAEVVKTIKSPAIRLLFPLSPVQGANGDALATLRGYRDLIGYVHVDFGHDQGDGNGMADPAGLGAYLSAELDYDGVVGFTCRAAGNAESCLDWIRKF